MQNNTKEKQSKALWEEGVHFLKTHTTYGIEECRSLIFLLAEELFQLSRIDISLNKRMEISETDWICWKNALTRLVKNEPLQYVLGVADFYGRKMQVSPAVLIPRSETEELVHLILQENPLLPAGASILDIGTGSGCIPVTLAAELPQATLYGMDISEAALQIAEKNARANQVNVQWIQEDILKEEISLPERFEIIVSNPPYVRPSEKQQMHHNVLAYEPHLALFVEEAAPLVFYKRIVAFACIHLQKGGKLYFEINEQFGAEIALFMEQQGFCKVMVRKDLQGKDRMVRGEK